jgi:hypothetical protein
MGPHESFGGDDVMGTSWSMPEQKSVRRDLPLGNPQVKNHDFTAQPR